MDKIADYDLSALHQPLADLLGELTVQVTESELRGSSLSDYQDLLNEAYALLDTLMVAMSGSLAEIAAAENDVQQALIQKQFEEIQKQLEASKANIFLKIFMPLLMALGIILLIASPLPIDPVSKMVLVGLLITMLADNIMSSATGESFLKMLFEKMTQGNQSLAQWLMLGFEVLVMLATLFATLGAASGTVATRLATVSARVQGFISQLSARGIALSKGAAQSIKNAALALSRLTASELQLLQKAMASAKATVQKDISRWSAMLEKLADNPAIKAMRTKVLSEKGSDVTRQLCDAVLLLSGMVVGSLSIDKSLVQMKLAEVSRDIDRLGAHADFLKDLRQEFLDRLEQNASLRLDLEAQMDTVIDVWRRD